MNLLNISYAHAEAKNAEGNFVCPLCKEEIDLDTRGKICLPFKDKYAIFHTDCLERELLNKKESEVK